MKKRRILSLIEIFSEMVVLFLLHNWSVVAKTVSFRRYAFMYFMLGIIFGRYQSNTNLIWDEIKKIILCNFSFFLATNVMNSLRMWSMPYILWNVLVFILMTIADILFERNYRILFRKKLAQNVLIIGTGDNAFALQDVYEHNRFALSKIVGVINCNHSTVLPGIEQKICEFHYPSIPFDELSDYLKHNEVDECVIALPDAGREQMQIIYDCINDYVSVVKSMPKVNGIVTYQSLVEDFDGIVLISSSVHQGSIISKMIKRLVDIFAGLIGIILMIPLTIYVKINFLKNGDHESVFFTQERIGFKGKLFRMYKYRSMIPHAEEVLDELMEKDEQIRNEYLENKKLEDDPRVTAFGKKIRKNSIDEFPQLINVLLGSMSLVGPRPYLPREKEDMGKYYETIIQTKPGITGMWQTHGRSEADFAHRLQFDDYYYRNWSIWLDLTILTKTVKTVNENTGAL